MKTKPVENVLPLPLSVEAQTVMDVYYEAIHEMVCRGTHIFAESLKQNKTKGTATEIDIAASLLFRHILELMDAISVQVKSGVIVPCRVHLRAILEAVFSLEYLLKENTVERAACFFIVDYYRKLNLYKKLTPGVAENENYLKEMEDSTLDYGDTIMVKGADAAYRNMEKIINKPIYKAAKEEYLKYTNQNTKHLENVKWYALYKGPTSLYKLAKELKHIELYEFFYKTWSNPTHGTDLWSGNLSKMGDGMGAINQMRDLQHAQDVVQQTLTLGLLTFSQMAEKVVIKERQNIGRWTIQFIRNHRTKVDNTKLVFS